MLLADSFKLLKEQFKSHFRNVSRIMDCVGCDKCRLWGKLQVSGLGTALKILFELEDKALKCAVFTSLCVKARAKEVQSEDQSRSVTKV